MDRQQYRGIKERAEQLGVSPAALRVWINKRLIGHVRFGRAIRISDEDVQHFIERNAVSAVER